MGINRNMIQPMIHSTLVKPETRRQRAKIWLKIGTSVFARIIRIARRSWAMQMRLPTKREDAINVAHVAADTILFWHVQDLATSYLKWSLQQPFFVLFLTDPGIPGVRSVGPSVWGKALSKRSAVQMEFCQIAFQPPRPQANGCFVETIFAENR